MAFRSFMLLTRIPRHLNLIRCNVTSSNLQLPKLKEYKTENNLRYLEDPDNFGTLSGKDTHKEDVLEDEGDVIEQKRMENLPLRTQKLNRKQYADLIKQYLKHKRLKEAIDVLEVRMLKEDRVKPENYIYNILIGACGDAGYTRKAFKLFNEMKRRALKPTGDTYTCLFNACANSPWAADGLRNATHLRQLIMENNIKLNLTNYNAMIKAFGQCGDLTTAFQIADEMMSLKIKIRVHTFNHLLHACISDKKTGLRHALVVWRKMLQAREKPNIFSFNLMLRCVKECNLGTKEDIEELISLIQGQMYLMSPNNKDSNHLKNQPAQLQIGSSAKLLSVDISKDGNQMVVSEAKLNVQSNNRSNERIQDVKNLESNIQNGLNVIESSNKVTLEFVNKLDKPKSNPELRTIPNLLSKTVNLEQVLGLKEVSSLQDKFAIIGGQEDFLKEMEVYAVKPDIKTITQMLALIDDSQEAEDKLLDTLKSEKIISDIDFYNMLIKKRCLRSDYEGAFAVKKIIKEESEFRKKRYKFNKKLMIKVDIMTYGVLSMACSTKELAEEFLNDMKNDQLKVNIQILGTLLRNGTARMNFSYIMFVMNRAREENIPVNDVFMKHVESFNRICAEKLEKDEKGIKMCPESFIKGYKNFLNYYKKWLEDMNVEEALQPQHPWSQFRENYPDSVQRTDVQIVEPKRYFKRNHKYKPYTPRL